jgi:competence protein ComGC
MKTKPRIKMMSRAFALREALVIIALLAVLAAMLLPAMTKAKVRINRINCANNLKQISLAFKMWPIDSTDSYPTQVSVTNGGTLELIATGNVFTTFLVMSNELNTPRLLICPGETDRRRQAANSWDEMAISPYAGSNPIPFTNNNNTSYFIGVDAEDAWPQMLLVGDSHFALGGKRVPPGLRRLGTNSPVSWPRPIRERHEKGGNIGLTDGSVMNCDTRGFQEMLRQSGDPNNRLAIP